MQKKPHDLINFSYSSNNYIFQNVTFSINFTYKIVFSKHNVEFASIFINRKPQLRRRVLPWGLCIKHYYMIKRFMQSNLELEFFIKSRITNTKIEREDEKEKVASKRLSVSLEQSQKRKSTAFEASSKIRERKIIFFK